jgi:phosphohistidine phosphatase
MKTLLVLRHAKASQESPSNLDFDRPLKPRGRAQALALGGLVRDRQLAFDAIVASLAARVVETVAGIVAGAGLDFEPAYDGRLYNASPETLLEVIREAGDTVERLLIVGHNPGLQHLLLHIAEDDGDGLRDEITSGFPTAALAELELSVEDWRDVGRRCGRIVRLVRPED